MGPSSNSALQQDGDWMVRRVKRRAGYQRSFTALEDHSSDLECGFPLLPPEFPRSIPGVRGYTRHAGIRLPLVLSPFFHAVLFFRVLRLYEGGKWGAVRGCRSMGMDMGGDASGWMVLLPLISS